MLEGYADPLQDIREHLINDEDGTRLYRAITRFMFEDGLTPDYQGSKTALQRDARQRAYGVIQSSWAWGTCWRNVSRMPFACRSTRNLRRV